MEPGGRSAAPGRCLSWPNAHGVASMAVWASRHVYIIYRITGGDVAFQATCFRGFRYVIFGALQ